MTRPPLPAPRGGFALAAVLLTISLLMIVLVVFSGVVGVESTSSGNAELNARARENAVTAMNLALGELQKEMGPDQRVSATAELVAGATGTAGYTNNAGWTGTWDATKGAWDGTNAPTYSAGKATSFREWLVSFPSTATNQATTLATAASAMALSTNTVALVGAGTCGVSNRVVAYKIAGEQVVTNGPQSYYAWWVGDEGVKARVNLASAPRGTATNSDGALMAAALTAAGGNPAAITNFAGSFAGTVAAQDALLRKGVTFGNLAMAYGGSSGVSLTNNFFDITPYSQGVLADVAHGGLRQDLTLLLEQSSAFGLNAFKAGTTATDFPQATQVANDPVYALGLNNNANSPSCSGYPWLYVYNAGSYLGTDWGYLYRYYNIYKQVFRGTGGAYTLNYDVYNAGLGNASAADPFYTPGSNPASPTTDSGGPYSADKVAGLGGIAYQWGNGQYPGRADFIVPLMLRLQMIVGMYQGSLDFPNVGKGTVPWPSAYTSFNPTVVNVSSTTKPTYYMALFPVAQLWNPYNIRIKSQTKKGNTAGLVWHMPCPPVKVNLDGAAMGAASGWEQFSAPDTSNHSIFWPFTGDLADLITGYGSSYGSTPVTVEAGAVSLYGPLPGKASGAVSGNAGGYFAWDGNLTGTSPSTANPWNAPSGCLPDNGQRTYNLATTAPGWPTTPLSPFLSHSLGLATSTCYVNGSTAPATYTYKNYITTADLPTLTVQAQFDFSRFGPSLNPTALGNCMLGGSWGKTGSTCLTAGVYEVNNTLGAGKTIDTTAYPTLPAGTSAALQVTASNIPAFPDSVDVSGVGISVQPTYLFMISLSRRVHPFDVQGATCFGLFNDPLARSYLVGGGGAAPALMSPYEYSLKYLQPNPLGGAVIYDPGQSDDGADAVNGGSLGEAGFDSGGKVPFLTVTELPVAPMLSLAQIQNVALGRDYGNPFNGVSDPRKGLAGGGYAVSSPAATAYAAQFNHAFGNSYAHPMIAANALNDGARSFDHSFYANYALWDRYFFSGVAPQDSAAFCAYNTIPGTPRTAYTVLSDFVSGASGLPDPRYTLYVPAGHASSEIQGVLLPNATSASFSSVNAEGVCLGDVYSGTAAQPVTGTTVTPYSQTSTYLMNQGAFNVNSVSPNAWAALLAGTQSPSLGASLNFPYNVTAGSSSSASTATGTTATALFPFMRFALPGNKGIQTSGGAAQNYCNGFHDLTLAQVQTLARNIVVEVKKRGPFLSLGEFVNRQISGDPTLNAAGALQSAIDGPGMTSNDSALADPKINTLSGGSVSGASGFANNAAANGPKLSGTPAYLTQADLLTPLANVISVRSDTFLIRSYGEVVQNGRVQARAWCEAVVQRVPEYVVNKVKSTDAGNVPSDAPSSDPTKFNSTNYRLGRKFKVIQFRWLAPGDV